MIFIRKKMGITPLKTKNNGSQGKYGAFKYSIVEKI